MNEHKNFISIDWGTSNFRMRLVNSKPLLVTKEIENNFGVKNIYQNFLNENEKNQKDYFLTFLLHQLKSFYSDYKKNPVVISGMASSNIGLFKLDYGELPFSSSAQNCNHQKIECDAIDNLILISGIKSKNDIMRGEETQAIGFLERIKNGVLLLPGTHSKHLYIENNNVINFKTFMTGELFELLSTKTILRDSISFSDLNLTNKKAFIKGFKKGFDNSFSNELFSIRANHILNNTNKSENYFLLSGLLIGNELSTLKNTKNRIYLAASKVILELYKIGLTEVFEHQKIEVFDYQSLEKAFLVGQKKILKYYE